MTEQSLALYATLAITNGPDRFTVVADGQYVIINFPSLAALERIASMGSGSGKSSGGFFKTLAEVNDLMRSLQLVVDIRVGGKSYVEFGSGRNARISLNAVFGKISSFFKR